MDKNVRGSIPVGVFKGDDVKTITTIFSKCRLVDKRGDVVKCPEGKCGSSHVSDGRIWDIRAKEKNTIFVCRHCAHQIIIDHTKASPNNNFLLFLM